MATTAKVPELYDLRSRTHDIDGREILAGALVEVVSPIPTSGRPCDIPPGEQLMVMQQSGGIFYVQDDGGVLHVSQGVRLRIITNGDPGFNSVSISFAPAGIPVTSRWAAAAQRGNKAARAKALAKKGKNETTR
jgi:hypothetical protein